MRKYGMLFAFFVCLQLNAQTDSSFYRNETGISIGRLAQHALGGEATQPWGFSYKYLLKKNVALRGTYQYKDYESYPKVPNTTLILPDSLHQYDSDYMNGFYHRVTLGAEARLIRKRMTFALGADIGYRHRREYYQEYREAYIKDSLAGSGGMVYYDRQIESRVILGRHDRGHDFTLGLTGAVLIPISKHWLLSFMVKGDFHTGITRYRTSDYLKNLSYTGNYRIAQFEGGPLLSDVSLFYRF